MGSRTPSTIKADPKAGAQTEKKHAFSLIASQRLHRRVVDDFYRAAAKRLFEVKANPTAREIMRLAERAAMTTGRDSRLTRHRTSNGSRGLHRSHHPVGRHFRAGRDFEPLLVAGGQHLHMGASDINDENPHAMERAGIESRLLSLWWPCPSNSVGRVKLCS